MASFLYILSLSITPLLTETYSVKLNLLNASHLIVSVDDSSQSVCAAHSQELCYVGVAKPDDSAPLSHVTFNADAIKPNLNFSEIGGPDLSMNQFWLNKENEFVAMLLTVNGLVLNADDIKVNTEPLMNANNQESTKNLVTKDNELLIVLTDFVDAIPSTKTVGNLYTLSSCRTPFTLSWHGPSNLHLLVTREGNTAEDIATLYGEWASGYEAELIRIGYVGHKSVLEELAQVINPPRFFAVHHPKILDAGCGTGVLGHLLRELYGKESYSLYGVDLSPDMLEVARQKNAYDELKACDVSVLVPYLDNEFDIILSSALFYQGSVGIAGINEILRVLKPNGILIATMWVKYFEKYEATLNEILLYRQYKIIKREKRPYWPMVEAYVVVIS